MLKYKMNVLAKMKEAGYNTTRIRRERIMSENILQNIREGVVPGAKTLNTICSILKCQPSDVLEWVEDEDNG